jgi:hypothetical protein
MFFIIILAATAAQSATCGRLHKDFDDSERSMAGMHDFYESMSQSDRQFMERMSVSRSATRQAAATASALGSRSGAASLAQLNA